MHNNAPIDHLIVQTFWLHVLCGACCAQASVLEWVDFLFIFSMKMSKNETLTISLLKVAFLRLVSSRASLLKPLFILIGKNQQKLTNADLIVQAFWLDVLVPLAWGFVMLKPLCSSRSFFVLFYREN